jgi:hypothetical protein
MMPGFTKFLLFSSVFLLLFSGVLSAQEVITVKGRVLEGTEPLPGVSISMINANGKKTSHCKYRQ